VKRAAILLIVASCKLLQRTEAAPDAAPDVAAPLPAEVTKSIEDHLGKYVTALYAKTFDEEAVKPFLAPASSVSLLEHWKTFRANKRAFEGQVRWGSSKVDEKNAHLAVFEHWVENIGGVEARHDLVTFYDLTLDPQRRVVTQVTNGALIGKKTVAKACMKSCMDRFSAWDDPVGCANAKAPRAHVKVGDVVGDLGETAQSGGAMLRKVKVGPDHVWLVDCLEWSKEPDGGLGFIDETPADICHGIAVDACKRACNECEKKEGFGCCVWGGKPMRIFCQAPSECVKDIEGEICKSAKENAAVIRACAAAKDLGTCSRDEVDDRGLELGDACDPLFK